MSDKLKPCRICKSQPHLLDGRYSNDGRADEPWKVYCDCGLSVQMMPEYGDENHWWKHPEEGREHMRIRITDLWNALEKRTGTIVVETVPGHQYPFKYCSECDAYLGYEKLGDYCHNCGVWLVRFR